MKPSPERASYVRLAYMIVIAFIILAAVVIYWLFVGVEN